MDEEETKRLKWMTVSLGSSLFSGGNLFICWLVGGAALSQDNDIVVELPCEG